MGCLMEPSHRGVNTGLSTSRLPHGIDAAAGDLLFGRHQLSVRLLLEPHHGEQAPWP